MRLPSPERAVVDLRKVRDYCLNPRHPRGRHKARVFQTALGFTAADADRLCAELRQAALTIDAKPSHRDDHGQRYQLDFELRGPRGGVRIRSLWIVRRGEDFARFTSCFVLWRSAT